MTGQNEAWDYCQIKFQLRYRGEDFTRAGPKQMWLVFQAHAAGPKKNYLASESTGIPIGANIIGASFVPDKKISGHVNIHQNLIEDLEKDGWELLPEKGSAWWERRLRRPARPEKSFRLV